MLLQLFLATLPQPPSRTSVRPTALLDWLAARGGGWSVDVSDQTPSGSRGLLTTRPAETGAVLLEVPLSATLMDAPTDDEAVEDAALLPQLSPPWSRGLPAATQLSLSVLSRRRSDGWAAFLASWPAESPSLAVSCEPDELRALLAASADPGIRRLALSKRRGLASLH